MKSVIINADDFGLSEEFNKAILEGYKDTLLLSASLCANGDCFYDAVTKIISGCKNLGVGVHLNVIEGKSLTKCDLLTDIKGNFKFGYLDFILNSYTKVFLRQIETEFRSQIEKIKKYIRIDHLDSHVHVHAIPQIFELTCRLAKEYNINYVRIQYEKLYFVPKIKNYATFHYPINLAKVALLNTFTKNNRKIIKKYGLTTTDFILGVNYTGMMDSDTIFYGLKRLNELYSDCIVKVLFHPCLYDKQINNHHYTEFLITQDKNLETNIKSMNFNIINCKNI